MADLTCTLRISGGVNGVTLNETWTYTLAAVADFATKRGTASVLSPLTMLVNSGGAGLGVAPQSDAADADFLMVCNDEKVGTVNALFNNGSVTVRTRLRAGEFFLLHKGPSGGSINSTGTAASVALVATNLVSIESGEFGYDASMNPITGYIYAAYL